MITTAGVAGTAAAAPPPADAPGGPGASATWTTGDKEGLGTSTTTASKVWYTLTGGTMSEVYYPNGNTPNVRELQFAVTDGKTVTQRDTDVTDTPVASALVSSIGFKKTSNGYVGSPSDPWLDLAADNKLDATYRT